MGVELRKSLRNDKALKINVVGPPHASPTELLGGRSDIRDKRPVDKEGRSPDLTLPTLRRPPPHRGGRTSARRQTVSLKPTETDALARFSVNRRRADGASRGRQPALAGSSRRRWGPEERRLREMLARDLHDRVAGVLATMLLDLRLYQQEERARGHEASALDHLESQARDVLHSVRDVVYELDGELLGRPLVASIAEQLTRNTSGDADLAAHLEVAPEWPSEVVPDFARTALAIVVQAVTNVRLHSGARAVFVRLGVEGDDAVFEIEDDGVGIGPDSDGSIGLRSMKQRAWLSGGSLSVRRRGSFGCVITARIPFGMTA